MPLKCAIRFRANADNGAANIPNSNLPHVFPVGRLDKASEGLLLFTNDTAWAARITDPEQLD